VCLSVFGVMCVCVTCTTNVQTVRVLMARAESQRGAPKSRISTNSHGPSGASINDTTGVCAYNRTRESAEQRELKRHETERSTAHRVIAEAAKSMPAFDLLSKAAGVAFSRRPACAATGGSRAAPEDHERGLETGTSDPQRRLEGDRGRYAGCVRRA